MVFGALNDNFKMEYIYNEIQLYFIHINLHFKFNFLPGNCK
jgi:hypothetical protein